MVNFLLFFAVCENKGFWPYDYVTSIDQLDEPLPPIDTAWFSKLKNRSVLGSTPEEIQHNYNIVKQVWRNECMTCLRDLLIKYQIDDVKPMVIGIENMVEHDKAKGVCIFKERISLPGVSKILMHRSASKSRSYFPLFNKSTSDLEQLFQ